MIKIIRYLLLAIVYILAMYMFLIADVSSAEEGIYTYYFPIVTNPPTKAGIAFSSHVDFESRLSLIKPSVSYWRGWSFGTPENKYGLEGVPSLWCDISFGYNDPTSAKYNLDRLSELGREYDGYLLFLNEPNLSYYGHHGQCEITPYRAAQIYAYTKSDLPNAKLVGPGIHHIEVDHEFKWMEEWFEYVIELSGKPPDMAAWDIHIYKQEGPPLETIDSLEGWLISKGIQKPEFWISEWGAYTPDRTHDMKYAFDNDNRIQRHYWYDAYGAWWDPPWVQEMTLYSDSNTLSKIGEAWVSDCEE